MNGSVKESGYTEKGLADSAIVFGDIYKVDGWYSRKCFDSECNHVLLIDTVETVSWQKYRIQSPVFF